MYVNFSGLYTVKVFKNLEKFIPGEKIPSPSDHPMKRRRWARTECSTNVKKGATSNVCLNNVILNNGFQQSYN